MNDGRCHFCGEPVDADRDYREVRGWQHQRQAGGANQITLRQETGRWACMHCVAKQKRGVATGQQTLG